jgi:predicted transcriptional regulator
MVNDLQLSGNDLMVYAIIYGFSQDGESRFTGSLQYLADWCNATKSGIQKNLKNLVDAGLIEKYESFKNNIKFCEYSCIPYNKVAHPMQQSCINNIDNNIDKDNTKIINDFSTQEQDYNSKCYSNEELRNEFLGSVKKPKQRRPINRKPTLFDKCVAEIDKFTDRADLREKLIQFLKIRLEVKDKPFGIESWRGTLDKLDQAVADCGIDYVYIVQQSIDKGWLSFYTLKEKSKTDKKESVFCDIDMPNTADIKVQTKEGNFSGKTF